MLFMTFDSNGNIEYIRILFRAHALHHQWHQNIVSGKAGLKAQAVMHERIVKKNLFIPRSILEA